MSGLGPAMFTDPHPPTSYILLSSGPHTALGVAGERMGKLRLSDVQITR